jgi:hypothetical protein
MSWAELLGQGAGQGETVVAPWLGGRDLLSGIRRWRITGALPPEHGWYSFRVAGNRKATLVGPDLADAELFARSERVRGYVIGNRLLADDVELVRDSARIIEHTRVVYLLEPGLERFARVLCAVHDRRLVYVQPEFPLGPESEVVQSFEDRKRLIDDIPGVTPALHMVFRWHTWWRDEEDGRVREEAARVRREQERQRVEAERQRAEMERQRQEAAREHALRAAERHIERRRAREQRRANRSIARLPSAQRAGASARIEAERALAAAGAEMLDFTPGRTQNEAVVRFRFLGHRFRSVVRVPGLRIIEAGICLTDAHSGERGDDRFTLASLPAVIHQAERQGQLVILRW